MHQNGHMRDIRRDLLQHLQPFAPHRCLEIREARNVPAGVGKARNEPAVDGLGDVTEPDGQVRRNRPQGGKRRIALYEHHVGREPYELFGIILHEPGLAVGPSYLDTQVAAFDPAEAAQTLEKSVVTSDILRRSGRAHQDGKGPYLSCLLSKRANRPHQSRPPANPREFPPPHSITSSARSRIAGGMVTPIARAVLRFTISFQRAGVSSGRSTALAPLRILSMNPAAMGASSARSGP